MGRQVNFYMHPDDLNYFQAEIARRDDVLILASHSSSAAPHRLSDAIVRRYGQEDLTIFLTRNGDYAGIRCQPIQGRDEFCVDASSSPVLEFSRCYFASNLIRRGRLWVCTGRWDSKGKWKPTDKKFLSWADSWIRWIRRHYKRLEAGDYIGDQAAAWAETRGHRLEAA